MRSSVIFVLGVLVGSAVATGIAQGDRPNGTNYVNHVAIAVDADAFVHAPSTTGVVRVERLSQPYWMRRLVGIRRVAALN